MTDQPSECSCDSRDPVKCVNAAWKGDGSLQSACLCSCHSQPPALKPLPCVVLREVAWVTPTVVEVANECPLRRAAPARDVDINAVMECIKSTPDKTVRVMRYGEFRVNNVPDYDEMRKRLDELLAAAGPQEIKEMPDPEIVKEGLGI